MAKKRTTAVQKGTATRITDAREQLGTAGETVMEFIEENPKTAAVIAAGVGVALGAALTASMKRR